MRKEIWDKKLNEKLLEPVLIIGIIPFIICCMFTLISNNGIWLVIGSIWTTFVIVIGLGAGGLDFTNKYGKREN